MWRRPQPSGVFRRDQPAGAERKGLQRAGRSQMTIRLDAIGLA